MSDWRRSKSLVKLMSQINAACPARDTTSDGAIGDAAHATRDSDHNPWVKDGNMGVVTAQDIDEDLNTPGLTLQGFIDEICASRDKRVKYIIYEGRITVKGSDLQQWKKYTGKNAHKHHAHISVFPDKKLYDSTAEWSLGLSKKVSAEPAEDPARPEPDTASAATKQGELDPTNTQSPATVQPSLKENAATEMTVTQEQGGTTVEASTKNEQDVNTPGLVSRPEPYNGIGFWPTIKRDLAAAGAGNLSFQGISEYAQQASGWPPWVIGLLGKLALVAVVLTAGYFVFRVIHYGIDTWKKNQKTKLEAEAATAVDRKDIEWTH